MQRLEANRYCSSGRPSSRRVPLKKQKYRTMQLNEELIRQVVSQVLAEVGPPPKIDALPVGQRSEFDGTGTHRPTQPTPWGVFQCVDRAVAAAREAFEQLARRPISDRERVIWHIRELCREEAEELGRLEMQETGVGRLEHKIEKLKVLADHVPGTEFLQSQCFSGDHGLTVIERAPFGVIGAITPVTHSFPTLAANAISMIAAGNTVVCNPHPSGKRIAAEGVRRLNRRIAADTGLHNLICVMEEPSIESADAIFAHRDIAMICVTGGPAVARAALRSGKRAVVAGPGNPPVVVDETADLDRAARSIIEGASYDNNLLCIGEKEIFVVQSVFEPLMQAFVRHGAVRLDGRQVDRLTAAAITRVGDDQHLAAAKEFIGKDAAHLAGAAGATAADETRLLVGETDHEHPFVTVEQMMPFVPVVPCADVDQAIDLARRYEHGFRHTSLIHSNSVRNMTRMGQLLDTTLFVKNGPCTAGNGIGGEGYFSYSIAGPTGEGITTPLTFTRERRCAMVENLWILGKPQQG